MGQKGDQHTSDAATAFEFYLNQLSPLEGLTTKKMFGGYGIFQEGKMFALVNSKGMCCLKVNQETRPDFESRGSCPLGKMPYFEVPPAVLEEQEELLRWAKRAIAISKAK